MKPYEWMVEYTPQTLWIEKKGVLVWLSEAAGILGGGLYLTALYFDSFPGMFAGWFIIAVLKSAFHFAHLGRPLRFWRLAAKPGSSWLSRGVIFMVLFIILGAAQMASLYLLPGTIWDYLLMAASGVAAFSVMVYAGFLMNYVRGLPFWSSGLLPLLLLTSGLEGGAALMLAINLNGYGGDIEALLSLFRWLLAVNALLVAAYLRSAAYASPAAGRSVKELTRGDAAPVLWLGVFLAGIAFPLGITLYDHYVIPAPPAWLIAAAAGALTGIFSLNYCLLRGAYYGPLINK